MSETTRAELSAEITVRNVGGIDETTVRLSPGVSLLVGRNATNRTSLLRAMMAALGSDDVSLKGDADEGRVELSVGGESHTRRLIRRDSTVTLAGDPLCDDAELADLFAFLLESNDARRAVEHDAGLRDLIMRPVDTASIRERIRDLESEKRRIDDELGELSELASRLPNLERRRADIESRIEEKNDELAEIEAKIEAFDHDPDGGEPTSFESTLAELRQTRSELEDARFDLESEKKSLAAVREERAEVEAELEDLSVPSVADADEIDAELEDLHAEVESLQSTVSELQTVIQFNEQMLDGTREEIASALADDADSALTDQLTDDAVVCWTCGTEVDRAEIEETLDRLRNLRETKLAERNELRSRIDELKTDKATIEERLRQRDQLERRLETAASEVDEREERIADLRAERDRLEAEIETLEAEVEALGRDDHDELLALHREANSAEFELGRLQSDLEEVEDEVAAVEERLAERDRLEERREEATEELADLRTRIDDLEADAVSRFNEHMERLLDALDYANLDRIWLERTGRDAGSLPGEAADREFELHVVRRTESGTAYEDTVDHLSESEREVTGLVFAFAGYLVHDVHEVVPFMLLDSLEAIDADRIAALVDHLAEYAPYLVVALLPEDAQALSEEYDRVTEV